MDNTSAPKTARASRISIAQLMHPEHANIIGNVHGGWIMNRVDEAGALACKRHAQRRGVTVAVDSLVFREPIKIGDLIILNAEVTYTGRTSMEVEVQVIAENPITGDCEVRREPFVQTSTLLGNRIWLDENQNGRQEDFEKGVGGV